MKKAVVVLVLSVLWWPLAAAAEAEQVSDCDRLASDPEDPRKIADGVPTSDLNLEKASAACENSLEAEPDNARLQFQLGRVYLAQFKLEKAASYMKSAAELGYAAARYGLARMVDKEQAPPQRSSIIDLYLEAAEGGHVPAMTQVSAHFLDQAMKGDSSRIDDAKRWMQVAANRGHPDAQFLLANLFRTGLFGTRDEKKTLFWARKSAEQDNIPALFLAGTMLWIGKSGERNDKEAVKYLTRIFELEDFRKLAWSIGGSAAYTLGDAYRKGRGVPKDLAAAREWYQRAAMGNHPGAKQKLQELGD